MRKKPRLRIGFDSNNWVSFCIGQKLLGLREVLRSDQVRVFSCDEVRNEFEEVMSRPNLQKYVQPERIREALTLMGSLTRRVVLRSQKRGVRDEKDDYLLIFAFDANLDYLITGDSDLPVLGQFDKTRFIRFADFLELLRQTKPE